MTESDGSAGTDPTCSTVLDPAILDRLAEELGSREAADQIVALYRDHLPVRVCRLCEAAARWDLPALLDAALSLRSSSAMIGATGLRDRGAAAVAAARAADRDEVDQAVSAIAEEASRTAAAIDAGCGPTEP